MGIAKSEQQLPVPITREETLLKGIYDKLDDINISSSPEKVGQAMQEYIESHPDFWDNIPNNTITRSQLADEISEQIRDEALKEISAEEVNEIFDSVFHTN